MIESSLRDRLLKVLRLAEQGVGGERANAQALLEKLLARHGLTMGDLMEFADEPTEQTFFDVSDHDEVALLRQLIDALLGAEQKCYALVGAQLCVGTDATPAEKIAIELAWEVYLEAWKEAKSELRIAFIGRHRLFDQESMATAQRLTPASLSEDEIAKRERINIIMYGLEHVERPVPRLSKGAVGGYG